MNLDGIELLDQSDVVERLLSVFRHPAYDPPRLPASAVKLLELTRRSDVAVAEVTQLLQSDQMLAAEVLRLAQSTQYSGSAGVPVRTLDEAIMRLGLQRTADLFLQAAMTMRVFKAKGYQAPMDALRRHSTAVAHLARLVSRQTSVFDEHAFLCGLLHDVGVAAGLIAIAESTPRGKKPPQLDFVGPAIEHAQGVAGAQLAKLWQLPAEVALVIEHHHSFIIGGYPHPTCAAINYANHLAAELGHGYGTEHDEMMARRALEALGLTAGDHERLLGESKKLLEALDE